MAELRRLSDPALAEVLHQLEAAVCAHPWATAVYAQTLASESERVQVLQPADAWLAVLVSEQILDELHIHNIFVPLDMQRRGHARAVLQAALAEAQAAGASRCLLEVRAGNAAAIGLYRSLGFVDCGVRKGYYRHEHGREDALLMECPLS
ncbi:ribosomal protein S18-alanine N-acetyltransferase [Vogesella indigofera]|uniref:[Ribosomal protein bS18]-alanine N-acetyltransferase n=1 Tax=Vogesella indigofera TaxID=45465 RepID=A0ABT5I5P4_VOGIN|nr:ribosomal protein S18-alanine N-acetyltransferase [Vogesella indigofera]MDC7691348.1 ribosomal protein S18-alanine N-acetyltransferase [Vogesella indigofera]